MLMYRSDMRDLIHAYFHAPPRFTAVSATLEMTTGRRRTVENDHRISAVTNDRT